MREAAVIYSYEAAPYDGYWQIRECDPRRPGTYRRVVARRRSERKARELVALILAEDTQEARDAVIAAAQDANWPK